MFDDDKVLDINQALFLMATLSPMVADGLDRETYRVSATSDESTEQYIFEDAFVSFMKDLENIGLVMSIPYRDIIEDSVKLSLFLDFTTFLLPNTLYQKIKTQSTLRSLIEKIIHGDLGDNETAIQIYMSELGGLDGTVPLVPHLSDFLDSLYTDVSQTDIFSDYLKNLIKLHEEERVSTISDDHRHERYRDKMRDVIGDLASAVNKFDTTFEYDDLYKLLKYIILDLSSADNFDDYAYLFLETTQTLPESLIENYKRKWYHYEVSHSWCYAYYNVRNLEISNVQQIMIACFTSCFSDTFDTYVNRMKPMREIYPDPRIDSVIQTVFQER